MKPIWISDRLQLRLRRGKLATADHGGARQSWTSDGKLALRWPVPPGGQHGCRVVLRKLDGWDRRELPVQAGRDGLEAVVPVGGMELFGERLPLRDGRWEITLRGPDDQPVAGHYAADAGPVTIGQKIYRAEGGGALVLSVGPALGPADRGRVRRKLVREVYYRLQRLLPVRDEVLLSSFHGKQCGDSPRAIADELRRRGDDRPQVWAVSDWSVQPPPGARAVLTGTRAYYAALGRAAYLVVNDHVALPYRKRGGQRHAQTWHGVPLKRLGYDITEVKMASGSRYLDYMASDVAQWDLLISPNPFSTPIMRTAFGYAGEIAETGYPRDDALAGQAAAGRAAQVRQRLGLPDGRKVALYVPTWRDNQHDAAGRYLLDFKLDLADASERLGGEYVLLIRGHHLMAGDVLAAGYPGFAFDVTGYPDINDLLIVADVLITDYSSVMFDFAPTGKPVLFFTYDLAQYRDEVRGFYFDFEADAPGPLLATSQEVVAALADLDSVAAKYAHARAAFTARFCPLDDGKASARACDRIFGG